ncbi:sterol desaturase family protein [Teredinibacter purpureus]|uniref:sterol desaturase family protein n=1 Tax=Teredinibacter purpureus TaxID=2731756 RepID=UPI0013C48C5F|nr:sterol desaturase family protein [Teredinibacter purpureus]
MPAPFPQTLSATLRSLPQPIYVLGFTLLSASACLHAWVDPWQLFTWVLWLSFPALLLAEWLAPRRVDWKLEWRELGRDTFWVLATYLFWVPFYSVYYDANIEALFASMRESIGLTFALAANSFAGLVGMALIAILAAEFITYWVHRLQHRFLFFWRMHATHHHISKMSVGRTDRTHPLEFLGLNIGMAVIFSFLGASPEVVAVAVMFKVTTVHMNHVNLPLTSGIFGWVFTTAESHQLHHSLDFDESNTNYGCAVILWDRIFGTFSAKADIDKCGNGSGRPLPLLTQLALPFFSDKKLKEL